MTPGGWTELWHGTLAFTSAATDNGPNSWGTNVLIATFNARTGWAGKTVWLENEQFTLEGHGPISAADVLLYDRQGYLEWAHAGLQEWVAAAASSAPAPWAANETAEAKARGGAASRPARDPVVDVKRVSRGDWVVGGGFLALLVGTSLPWYTWSGSYLGAEFHFVDTGWTSAAGVLSFLTVLAAVVLVILASGVLPQLHIDFHGRLPVIVIGLATLALAIVLIRLVAGPGSSSGFGVGIFLSLLGAAAVAVGGFLKLGEPTPVVVPSKASVAVDNAVGSAKAALTAARVAVKTQSGSTASPSAAPPAPAVSPPVVSQTTTGASPVPVEPHVPSSPPTAAAKPLVMPQAPPAPHAAMQTAAVVPAAPEVQPESSPDPQPTLIEPPAPNVVAELTKLANLKARGMLTDEEFADFKAKLME